MISVRNHHLLLNGNNRWLALFGLLLIFSCSISKKTVENKNTTSDLNDQKKVYNPLTGRYEPATPANTKVDTIQWTEIDEIAKPPLRDEDIAKSIPYSEKKSSYNISLLLPLRGNQLNNSQTRVNKLTEKFVHYHAGFRMGLQKLDREGIPLNVNILDIGSEPIQQIQSSREVENADVIIGPYRRTNIEAMASYAKARQIPIITPWSSFDNLGDDNPYFIMPKPSFNSYCEAIVDDIMKKFHPRDVRIVIREGDEYLYQQFHRYTNKYGIEDTAQSFKTYLVNDTTIELSETPVDSHLIEDRNNIFIIPYYRSTDERFVYSFIRRLSIGNSNNSVYIYGMPQWKYRVEQDYYLYNSMKIYIPSTGLIQSDGWDYQQITERCIRDFGMLPTDDVLEAYDLIVFVGRMLFKYGKNFQYFMDVESYDDHVFASYKFQRMLPTFSARAIDDRMLNNTGFENKHVQLIQLKEFKYIKVN